MQGFMLIAEALNGSSVDSVVQVQGWVRTARYGKKVGFIKIYDGSSVDDLQLVIELAELGDVAAGMLTGTCIWAQGELVKSQASGQEYELIVRDMGVIGACGEDYLIQKKRHTIAFLRKVPHLRNRTRTFQSVFRMRHALSMAIHSFLDERDFTYIHTPLITGNDCEGAGESFQVDKRAKWSDLATDAEESYFGGPAYLSVSGQLEVEAFVQSHGRVYTFGPIFRADPSDTPRHACEFWMIEPEMAFFDLERLVAFVEDFVVGIAERVRQRCAGDVEVLSEATETDLGERFAMIAKRGYTRMTFESAVETINGSGETFEVPASMTSDLTMEHEKYLADELARGPLVIANYPGVFKPFYMRSNDDGRTVECFDLLLPDIGEIITGSQREERMDVLVERMKVLGVPDERLEWYLDTRRFGSCPHAGFGLGFDRLLMYLTGMRNIRDVLPFPRYYKWSP